MEPLRVFLRVSMDPVCRICVFETQNLTSISVKAPNTAKTFASLLMEVSNLQLSPDDGFPQGICDKCISDLNAAIAFKERCESSTETLLGLRKTKREPSPGIYEEFVEDFVEVKYSPAFEDEDSQVDYNETFEDEKSVKSEVKEEPAEEFEISSVKDGSNKTRYKCPFCPKTLTRTNHVKRHIHAVHRNDRCFKCEKCDKTFARKDHLLAHLLTHFEKGKYKCEECQKLFTRLDALKNHMKRHSEPIGTRKIHPCPLCQKSFTSEKYLLQHQTKCGTSDKEFPCKFCVEVFKSKADLTEHTKVEHAKEREFLCTECGKQFLRSDFLAVHMRRHTGDLRFICKFCGKAFPRSTDLTVHERYHTQQKSHYCSVCGKGFQRSYNLLVHSRTHTGSKPYSCPHCVKSFSQSNDLKAHIRRHTGERFRCEICNEGFIQGYNLKKHKREKHGIESEMGSRRVEKFVSPTTEQNQTLQGLSRNESELRNLVIQLEGDLEKVSVEAKKEILARISEAKGKIAAIEVQRLNVVSVCKTEMPA